MKRVPLSANLLRVGIFSGMRVFPCDVYPYSKPAQSARHWSAKKSKMFGGVTGVGDGGCGAGEGGDGDGLGGKDGGGAGDGKGHICQASSGTHLSPLTMHLFSLFTLAHVCLKYDELQ